MFQTKVAGEIKTNILSSIYFFIIAPFVR